MKSFIRFPVVRFKKADLSHESLKERFFIKETRGIYWKNEYISAISQKNFDYADALAEGQNITIHKYVMDLIADSYTLDASQCFDNFMVKAVEYCGNMIKLISCDEDYISIKAYDGSVTAEKFSHAYPQLANKFPELKSDKRHGLCHKLSLRFAALADDDAVIATGYTAPLAPKNRILHSWIETELDGRDVVIDFVRGLVFDKESYYYLKNVRGGVERIDTKVAKKEIPILQGLYDTEPFFTKVYFSNHNMALKIYRELENKKQENESQREN